MDARVLDAQRTQQMALHQPHFMRLLKPPVIFLRLSHTGYEHKKATGTAGILAPPVKARLGHDHVDWLSPFQQSNNKQQNERTNRSAYDLTNQAWDGNDARQQKTSNDRPENTDNNVADQTKAGALHDLTSKPTGNGADNQHNDNCNGIHNVLLFLDERIADRFPARQCGGSQHKQNNCFDTSI